MFNSSESTLSAYSASAAFLSDLVLTSSSLSLSLSLSFKRNPQAHPHAQGLLADPDPRPRPPHLHGGGGIGKEPVERRSEPDPRLREELLDDAALRDETRVLGGVELQEPRVCRVCRVCMSVSNTGKEPHEEGGEREREARGVSVGRLVERAGPDELAVEGVDGRGPGVWAEEGVVGLGLVAWGGGVGKVGGEEETCEGVPDAG
ncbi:hypothetical protein LshimejAT787_0605090 [Lyophyllum shimeji]|uniref:Uncharacterized protein n=1 Tax=Lyophyllum shimeji TaxID=47721 RepID=A0A9P3PQ50_LYOSH|nr:hypothetical protein LshimejAT787_0605090 [Lyophyllum shimeji]